jgi:hypothetical protein
VSKATKIDPSCAECGNERSAHLIFQGACKFTAKKKKKKKRQQESRLPDWYNESKLVNATFAFENGRSAYGGYVIDLGDGTCRIANDIMLGEDNLKWGDRVDLFYNPCDRFSRPYIGYRVYDREKSLPSEVPGKNYGAHRKPTKEETAKHKKAEAAREKQQIEDMERSHENNMAALDFLGLSGQYLQLLAILHEKNIEVPTDLQKLPTSWKEERDKRKKRERAKKK